MSESSEKISIIIPTYNRINSIKRTFECLSKSDILPDEVIIVDQTQDKILAHKIKDLCAEQTFKVIYKWHSKPSLTQARNIGLVEAHNDIIIFMDDDIDVRKDTLANVISLFSDSRIAMVAGYDIMPPKKNSVFSYLFNKASFRRRHTGHVSKGIYGRFPITDRMTDFPSEVPTEWAMGFFFVVKKSLVNKWNLRFDENLQYYAYAEDLDFTYLYYQFACKEGLLCVFSLRCSVIHNVSKEYRTAKRALCFMMIIHREYIRYKHFGGNKYFYSLLWSSVGDVISRIIRKESTKDILDALIFMLRHKKEIRKGIFFYEQFMDNKK